MTNTEMKFSSFSAVMETPVKKEIKIGRLDLSNKGLSEVPSIPADLRDQITELKLNNNRLKSFPNLDLPNLQSLDLSHNLLDDLPEGITRYTHLRRLVLSYNQFKSIPIAVCRLTNLRKLHFEFNDIREVPREIMWLVALKEFNIIGNKVKELPIEMGLLAPDLKLEVDFRLTDQGDNSIMFFLIQELEKRKVQPGERRPHKVVRKDSRRFSLLRKSPAPEGRLMVPGQRMSTGSINLKTSTEQQRRGSVRENSLAMLRNASSGESFEYLLNDEHGYQDFKDFLVSEYASENVLFWQAVQSFKLAKPLDLKAEALDIISRFMTEGSQLEVNLPNKIKEGILLQVEKGEVLPTIFHLAERHIYGTMKEDSYMRYKQKGRASAFIKRFLEEKNGGRIDPGTLDYDSQ